ncbi:Alpha/Beta hydrolase protein [Xylariales sp. AK1849]|nr:Alpha/Beta hydrolase protein [Xylariales sp. AK1849]
MFLFLLAVLLSAALVRAIPTAGAQPAKRSCAQSDLTVDTPDGVVHGIVDDAAPDVRQFLGIPYGRPPVGDLRFAPPQAVEPYGEINATKLPPSCMQYLTSLPGIWINDVLEFNQGGLNGTIPTSLINEDCLTMSVWAPRGRKKNLPVLIWVYGGSFKTGGQNVPYQLPTNWIQRSPDHIVVAFNYRLNFFGFPNAAGIDDDQQNLGLMDQRLAVEWVRDNIAAFGGDPSRMALWGQSAGGVSVGYYSYTYPDDPIVSSLIMESGNELLDITANDPTHSNFTFMASQVGCGNLEPTEELACMRQVDPYAIEDFLHSYLDAGTEPTLDFAPVVDEMTVFSDFYGRALAGNVSTLPAILGSNRQDGVPFVPYDPNGVNLTLAFEATLEYFFCPAWKSATTRIAAGAQVFRYEYSGNFSNISPKSWMGSWHDSEIPLVFGTHSLYRGSSTALENETSIAMQDAWVSFVSGGQLGFVAQEWPSYTALAGGFVRDFGSGVAAQTANFEDWENLCPEYFQP